ncbi:hypothetical protein [Helicobacter marmotae]|uniref:hypothetical protein n=1 Tax=Helicobacter marmotae TaxID=152490 RepID=UPI0011C065BF|nr:hypothetical protein [Helicobacter marmotae]
MSCLAGFMPEESLQESLVAKRDSSVATLSQNDNSGRVSSNSNSNFSLDSQAQNDKLCVLIGNRLNYPQGKPTHNKPYRLKPMLFSPSKLPLSSALICFKKSSL